MSSIITSCACNHAGQQYCQLTPAVKGWGCKHLTTPIDHVPMTDREKAKLFSLVYREAKHKGVTECPHYRSLFIDEVLDNNVLMMKIIEEK